MTSMEFWNPSLFSNWYPTIWIITYSKLKENATRTGLEGSQGLGKQWKWSQRNPNKDMFFNRCLSFAFLVLLLFSVFVFSFAFFPLRSFLCSVNLDVFPLCSSLCFLSFALFTVFFPFLYVCWVVFLCYRALFSKHCSPSIGELGAPQGWENLLAAPGEPPWAIWCHCPLRYWVRTLIGKPS